MAKAWLAGLLSELHREALKALGFGKVAGTFSRPRGPYIERFHFQGSSWSSADVTTFYLNVGVEFADFAPRQYWSHFKGTHWAGRVRQLVASAPENWRCDGATDRPALRLELSELIARASRELSARLCNLRSEYLGQAERTGRRPEPAAAPGFVFDPRWRTMDVAGLARGIAAERAFDRLPLLADALMDAGCAVEAVLEHCRGAGPHVRGCWVVDAVLGKE